MNKGPIYIVDNDSDDQTFLLEAYKELGYENELCFFTTAQQVIAKLKEAGASPFLILCDVNLPKIDGFQLKTMIAEDASISVKSIPFLFWSGLASELQIKKAYDLGAHGFFIKGTTMQELKVSIQGIMTYWLASKQPKG